MMADVSGESGCCRDKEDEIYITSASVIELDCRKAADNDSYDSGIYNSSNHTGDQWQCSVSHPGPGFVPGVLTRLLAAAGANRF